MQSVVPKRRGKARRQEQIVADLRLYPAMRVNELSERLGVSSETIRRDLAELDDRGPINRMMRRSSQTLVLAKHSKVDRPSLTIYGPWNDAVALISDSAPDGELAAAMAEAWAALLIAAPNLSAPA